jgi:preprotein translocase subunit SecA
MDTIEEDALRFLYLLQPVEEKKQVEQIERKQRKQQMILNQVGGDGNGSGQQQVKRDAAKVGRNDPCPCGSGKKFKKCHGVTV